MARTLEREEDSAAPTVPEARANAAEERSLSVGELEAWSIQHTPELLRPKFGPDIYIECLSGRTIEGYSIPTRRSISPWYKLCRPMLAQVAGV